MSFRHLFLLEGEGMSLLTQRVINIMNQDTLKALSLNSKQKEARHMLTILYVKPQRISQQLFTKRNGWSTTTVSQGKQPLHRVNSK
jgi:hypothetical protein